MLIKLIGTNGTLNFADNRDLSIHLAGKASQNNQSGTFEADLLLSGLLSEKPSEGIHFDLALSSPLTSLAMEGQLNKGILTLKKPLKWNFILTPEMRAILIKKKIPFLRTAIQGEAPITLTIDPAGFTLPLNPFDLNAVQIEKGTFELGKIQFQNEGELSSILNLISPIQEKQFTLWFTPIYFQMNKGIVHLNRFDFLVANLYQLASWGQIDLKNHQSSLILGLTSQSLDFAFGIKSLKDDYILQIPLKEKNGRIEVDKKQAAARISALLAQLHGNSQTKLLGNVLEFVAKPTDASPPLPTTKPFPWPNPVPKEKPKNSNVEIGEKKEETPSKEAKKKRKNNQQLILEGLEKEATGLLKKWIK